jgi:hypothetical protein
LLIVNFGNLMSRHVFDIIVVSYHRISIYSRHVGLLESFGEYSGVFLVKENEYSIKAALFLGVFPVALVSLALEILLDSALSPVAEALLVLPQTLRADALGDGVDVLRTLQPVSGSLRIKLLVIVGLKGEPASLSLLGVSEFYSLFKYN